MEYKIAIQQNFFNSLNGELGSKVKYNKFYFKVLREAANKVLFLVTWPLKGGGVKVRP